MPVKSTYHAIKPWARALNLDRRYTENYIYYKQENPVLGKYLGFFVEYKSLTGKGWFQLVGQGQGYILNNTAREGTFAICIRGDDVDFFFSFTQDYDSKPGFGLKGMDLTEW